MSEVIEIEFKNLLTKNEYTMLLETFNINEQQIFSQENYYFDTADFDLQKYQSALRIRKKKNHYELTLKQPADIGLLETNQIISSGDLTAAIQHNRLPDGPIKDKIIELGVNYEEMVYFGSLATKRSEISYHDGLLVLDHSTYLNKEDYEVEYEVKDYQQGIIEFQKFLERFGIPKRKTDNKIKRFYLQKNLQNNRM